MIVDTDFPDHWKTRMLVDLLGGDEAAPVYLLRLWAHCQKRRASQFDALPSAALKAICRFPGDADLLDGSLCQAGFIHREGGSVSVCGWDEYNSSLIANWENGKRGGRPKKQGVTGRGKTQEKPMGLDRDNPSQTDKIREDKIREEKNKQSGDAALAFDADFSEVWAIYPRRSGGNPRKPALKAYTARRRQGVEHEDMMAGVARYARYCDQRGNTGTQYVLRASTFFGPDEHWKEPYSGGEHAQRSGHSQAGLSVAERIAIANGLNADGSLRE